MNDEELNDREEVWKETPTTTHAEASMRFEILNLFAEVRKLRATIADLLRTRNEERGDRDRKLDIRSLL